LVQAVLQHWAAVALGSAKVALFFPRAGRRAFRSAFLPRCLLSGAMVAYRYARQPSQKCHFSVVFHGVSPLFYTICCGLKLKHLYIFTFIFGVYLFAR
jgi:hypothetical protein